MAKSTSEIPGKLFYKIGEVCEITDTQPYVLRFWESEFPQLAPRKNRSGQRVYERKDIEMILRIKELLYQEEYTIAGARKKLDEEGRPGGRNRASTPAKPSRPAAVAVVAPSRSSSGKEADHPVDALEERVAQMKTAPAQAGAAAADRRLEKALAELKTSLRDVLELLRGE